MNSSSQLPKRFGNAEVERNILGAIFVDRSHVATAAEFLEPDHFSVGVNSRIFRTILELDRDRVEFDEILVSEKLSDDPEFAHAGGVAYLANLSSLVHRMAPVKEYCKTVRELAARQQMQRLYIYG